MENVTRGMIRSGWKGYSDSFDPWMGRYGDFESDYYGYASKTDDDESPVKTEETFKEKYNTHKDGPNKGKTKIPWWYNLGGIL